jgi:hypothetical protein
MDTVYVPARLFVCENVVGVVDGPTVHAMWLLSVMTVTMVLGVCMVCARVHGVRVYVFVGIGRWRVVLFGLC